MKNKDLVALFIILCFVGTILEWAYGTLWSIVGQAPWIYPNSILRYTSFEGFPLWGVGGLVCIAIYRAYCNRNWKMAVWVIPLLILAVLWVSFYGLVIQ